MAWRVESVRKFGGKELRLCTNARSCSLIKFAEDGEKSELVFASPTFVVTRDCCRKNSGKEIRVSDLVATESVGKSPFHMHIC